MKLFIDKDKSNIKPSLNGFFLEIETDGPIEFIGGDGNEYCHFDEDEEGIGPAPTRPFVVAQHQKED